MHPLFDLTDKVALVTGSTKGSGRAMAETLAEFGARVVISSRKADLCDEVAQGINDRGGEAIALPCNISHVDQLQKLVDDTVVALGPVDVLISNAAVNPYYGPLLDIDDSAWEKTFGVNVTNNIRLCGMVIPSMAERGGGAVMIFSRDGGLIGSPTLGAYGITKAADMQLVRNLALEWGPKNVRVNCIAPGLVKTNFARVLWEDPDLTAAALKGYPMGRLGEPEDLAGIAVYLASKAGSWTTGQVFAIDGGTTITTGDMSQNEG